MSTNSNTFNCTSISPNANRHSDNLTIWSHITSNLLEKWFNDPDSDSKLIIIDSRETSDYSKKHIKNSINLPASKILCQQLKSDKISINELLIKYSDKDLISNNIDELNIVVYDQKSEHTNQLDFEYSFTILLLKKLAQKYKSVSFLTEGFVNFYRMYPKLCEGLDDSFCPITPLKTYPIVSVTSEATPSPKETEVCKQNLFNLKPRQLRLNHSLSTYGIDLNSSSNSAVSSISSLVSLENDAKNQPNYLGSPSEDVQPLKEPTKILDFLFLGSQEDALSKTSMQNLDITYVLNVSITCPKPDFIIDANFLRIPINDGHTAKIITYFDVAFKFIEKCRKANKKVLIHCLAGISRSPTLAIAYLMRHLNLKSDEAYKLVKDKRKTISPNFNFLGQLYEYEKQLMNNECLDKVGSESTADSACLAYLKFEMNSQQQQQQQQPESHKLNFTNKKKPFIFKFTDKNFVLNSPSKQNYSLLSPSTAFSNFNLNSPNVDHKPLFTKQNVVKSFTCNSIKDINTTSQTNQKQNVVMRRPTNLSLLNDTKQNSLKRPSSILLNGNFNVNKLDNEPVALTRTFSNTSAGSASSTCSTCSNNSNTSCNCGISKKDSLSQIEFQNQKKIKLSPIEDRLFFNNFCNNPENEETKPKTPNATITSPLTPNSIWNTNNIVCSFNQKLNYEMNSKKMKTKFSSDESGDVRIKEDMSEEDDEENNENSLFVTTSTNKSSSSSSSSNKNSLHGSIETMIEVL